MLRDPEFRTGPDAHPSIYEPKTPSGSILFKVYEPACVFALMPIQMRF